LKKETTMSYSTGIEGFEGQNVEVKTSFWTGPKLLINSAPAPKGKKRGEMLLQRNDGRQVSAVWRQQFMGFDVPQLIVDGKVINIVEPLPWYQWLWVSLPILLVFMGGIPGTIIGIIAFTINAKTFRTELNDILKYLATGAVSILAAIIYFIVALLITIFMQG
jgi:hypothetical protein